VRIGNVQGRPWLITGEDEGFDIGEASAGRFGPGLKEIYEQWPEFTAWAPGAAGGIKRFSPEDLGPPSPEPRQVFAIGLNYRDHAEEAGLAIPAEPLVFTKYVSSFTGPSAEVALPPGTVVQPLVRRLDRQLAAPGHRVARVDAKIHWHLVQFGLIAAHH